MKRLGRALIVSLLLLALATPVALAQTFKTYENDRFNFAIDYPSDLLVPQPPPDNNDGRKFLSRDGRIELRAYAGHNIDDETMQQLYGKALGEYQGARVTKRAFLGNYFVLSGQQSDRIFYLAKVMPPRRDIIGTMLLEYPASERSRIEPSITRMFISFLMSFK